MRLRGMIAALREAGLRVTPQRVAVCRALAESRSHPTAQALFEQLSAQFASQFATFSRATVYNTLETLARVGRAQQLVVAGDGAMHFDSNLAPHAHLVCNRCYRVEDYDDPALAQTVGEVSLRSGYVLRGLCVFYHGLCPACQTAASE
jgi:Fur family peroxide stress response transcriptional regulator